MPTGLLRVNSRAFFLGKNSDASLAKIGQKSGKIGQNRLKIGKMLAKKPIG